MYSGWTSAVFGGGTSVSRKPILEITSEKIEQIIQYYLETNKVTWKQDPIDHFANSFVGLK